MRMQIKLLYIADVNAKCYSHFEKNVWQFLINPKPPAPFYSAIPLQLFTHDANTGSHKHFQVNGHTASFTPKPQTEDNPIVLHGMQGQLLAGPFTGWLFHNKKILKILIHVPLWMNHEVKGERQTQKASCYII